MSKVTEYMFSKRILPILLLVLVCGVVIAFRTLGTGGTPPSRYERVLKNIGQMLAQPFDFTKDEKTAMDPKKMIYPKNEAERKEDWRKMLKYQVLERYVDLLDGQEKIKGKDGAGVKSNEELEKDARAKVLRAYD